MNGVTRTGQLVHKVTQRQVENQLMIIQPSLKIQLHFIQNGYTAQIFSDNLPYARAAKPTVSSLRLIQLIYNDSLCRTDLLQNQLRNPIANLYAELFIAKIKQYNTDLSSIIGINDTRTDIDKLLDGEPRARCYASITADWDSNTKTSFDERT